MEAARAICSPSTREARRFERHCEALRPLGETFLLRRFAGQLSRADAEDAVAEVLIRLHRQFQAGRLPDNLRAAFFTGVRNAAIDQLRSRAAKPTASLELVAEAPAPEPVPAERAESGDDSARLQEALVRMRGNYREAIVLRFGLGLTVPEISRHLGISLPAAKKLVLRATRQARCRLEEVESAQFCPEMQEQARRSLFDAHASGTAGEEEARILRAHLEHCGSCKSFLASLHDGLRELGTGALLAGTAGERLGAVGVAERLAELGGAASDAAQAGADKLRIAALKACGALPGADAGAAGALATTGQKIAALCGAATATAATCVAAGVVGPGVAAEAPPAEAQKPAPKERSAPEPAPAPELELPVEAPIETPEPAPSPPEPIEPESSPPPSPPPSVAPTPEPVPVQEEPQPSEFGIESSGTETVAPPTTKSAPSTREQTNSGGGFGFGGSGGGGSTSGGGGVGFQG